MARFEVCCSSCSRSGVVNAPRWRDADKACLNCGGELKRVGQGPSVQVQETLDNGVMARRLTRLAEAERLHEERRRSADPRAGKAAGQS